MSAGPLSSGDRVAGRFVIEGLAGSGSMGAVYSARDSVSGDRVALKVLVGGEQFARFEREIQVIARLHHPRIVRYVAHGRTERGRPFLAMEWLDGETLQARLDRSTLTILDTIEVGRAVAEALVAAHANGVIHRDLKPSNIMLVNGAVVALKVVDFGIAKVVTDGQALTGSRDIVGTPAYMSPEQALSRKDIDARSDVFSLGSILYHGLTGAYPFVADSPLRVLLRLANESATSLSVVAPNVPARLAELVDAMLAHSPQRRPADAMQVHAALSSIRAELAPSAKVSTGRAVTLSVAPPHRLRTLSIALLVAGALAVGGIVAAWVLVTRPSGRAPSVTPPSATLIADGSCPGKALECAHLTLRDPTHADPLAVAAAAQAVAGTLGGGSVTSVVTERLTRTGVDLSNGAGIVVHVAHGLRIVVEATRMVVYRDGGPDGTPVTMPAPGGCDVKAAYSAALQEGLKPAAPWEMTFSDEGEGTGYLFVAPDDEKWTRLLFVREADCTRGSVTLP